MYMHVLACTAIPGVVALRAEGVSVRLIVGKFISHREGCNTLNSLRPPANREYYNVQWNLSTKNIGTLKSVHLGGLDGSAKYCGTSV